MFQRFFAFVDGEFVFRVEGFVAPRLVYFVVEFLSLGARHEPHDDDYRDEYQGRAREHVAPIVIVVDVVLIHILCVCFCLECENTKKICYK